ncbi:MAG TPA: alpha/beta fold hydrolase [Bacteroidota bacterium]|nr:alpha/beta fold hydrolase [Bacteroidota bacterium]
MQLIQSSLVHQLAPFDATRPGPHPTLILLHGRGASEEDLLGLVPYVDPRFFCIAARAPFRFGYGGYTWYDLQEVGAPESGQFDESYQKLSRFLDDVQTHYPVDPRQTFLLGFSMGTVMSYSLALTRPERIRGVVAHSGYIPEKSPLPFKWDGLAHTEFFVAHGVYDPVIPVDYGRRAQQLLSASSAPLVYREYPIQHQISDESLHDLAAWLSSRLQPGR